MSEKNKHFWETMKKNKWTIVIGAVILLGAFYFGFSKNGSDEAEEGEMQTAKVRKGNIEISVTGSGQVQAASQVDLKPQVAGDGLDVTEVAVKNDQAVKEGDLIAVLDMTEAGEKVREARLSLQSAEIALKQTENEFSNETKDDKYQRQTKEIAVAQRQTTLNNVLKDLEDYYVQAPFDGTVTGLNVQPGDSIARTETLASVITESDLVE